jgi:GNAT superfamily N-acetyltransferase
MKKVDITIENEYSESAQTIVNKLIGFNRSHTGFYDDKPLCIYMRCDDGEIIGGLIGRTYWGWLYIDAFLIGEEYRSVGLGTQLLEFAEKEALSRGCHNAYLDTFDFQARQFYELRGYKIFGKLDNFPDGHVRYFMQKKL